eukprot:COSAG04_NODE_262_length_18654_cov_17.483751_8_plen_774_part_00
MAAKQLKRTSKALSWLLRHGAEKEGLAIRNDGFVRLAEILAHRSLRGASAADIEKIVATSDKQRFARIKEGGEVWVRANQGHSMGVSDAHLLTPVTAAEAPVCIHGTYRACIGAILREGLSRMARNHVHCAALLPEQGVVSGMRSSCEIAIYVDVQAAMDCGLSFFKSANDVLLTRGPIPPSCFEKVVDLATGALVAVPEPRGPQSRDMEPLPARTAEDEARGQREQRQGRQAAAAAGTAAADTGDTAGAALSRSSSSSSSSTELVRTASQRERQRKAAAEAAAMEADADSAATDAQLAAVRGEIERLGGAEGPHPQPRRLLLYAARVAGKGGKRWGRPRQVRATVDDAALAAAIAAALGLPKREAKKMRVYLTASGAELGAADADAQLAELGEGCAVHLSAVVDGSSFVANPAEAARLQDSVDQDSRREAERQATRRREYVFGEYAPQPEPEPDTRGPVLFWRDGDSNGYLSNWHSAPMEIAGQRFTCVEQYYMWRKAVLFSDGRSAEAILSTTNPSKMKKVGREVSGFKPAQWRKAQPTVLLEGNRAKFNAHPVLAARLVSTGDRPIAEASPSDSICGIGLGPLDPRARDPSKWQGMNLLGRALETVREELNAAGTSIEPEPEPEPEPCPDGAAAVATKPQLQIVSFSYDRGQPQDTLANVNARTLTNPGRSAKGRTGLDRRLSREVLATPGAAELVDRVTQEALHQLRLLGAAGGAAPAVPVVRVGVGCDRGLHRSVAVAEAATAQLARLAKAGSLRGVEVLGARHRELS